jgi:hypothetical protein
LQLRRLVFNLFSLTSAASIMKILLATGKIRNASQVFVCMVGVTTTGTFAIYGSIASLMLSTEYIFSLLGEMH